MERYDVIIVGSGAAGLTAAMTARRRGARVAMLESRKIGGECTQYGCVPSKSVLAVSRLAVAMKTASRYGLTSPPVPVPFSPPLEDAYLPSPEKVARAVRETHASEAVTLGAAG